MDKQIIIDGIDVSGCERYNPNIKMDCLLHPLQSDACKNNPNCHYKLYKRKEQECEEFRKANDEKNELLAKLGCPTIATARRKVFCLQEQLDQLKAELEAYKMEAEEGKEINAELKAECENWKSLCKYADKQIDELQAEVETLQQLKDEDSLRITQLATENLKLKQTLTEIKEFAEKALNMVDYKTYFKRDNKSLKQEGFKAIDQILQKIREVENVSNSG